MIEPWLGGIILITVFLVVLSFYMVSRPTLLTREEKERSEILATLQRIEAALNQNAPTQNPKDRHEEKD